MKQPWATISPPIHALMLLYRHVVLHWFICRSDTRLQPLNLERSLAHSVCSSYLLTCKAVCLLSNQPPPPPSSKSRKMKLCFFLRMSWSWGTHLERHYIFHRRRLLDFLWVSKNRGKKWDGGGSTVGTIKLSLISRGINTKLSWYASFMT